MWICIGIVMSVMAGMEPPPAEPPPPAAATQARLADLTRGWPTETWDYYVIRHPAGREVEAGVVRDAVQLAIRIVLMHFATHDPDTVLRSSGFDLTLHDTDPMGLDLAVPLEFPIASTGHFALHVHARIAGLARDPEPDGSQPRVTALVATVLLDRLTRDKPQGWQWRTAPAWFLQGYPRYVAAVGTASAEQSATLRAARHRLRQPDGRPASLDGARWLNPADDGAVVLQFLVETFGAERVQAVLLSRQPSFEGAVVEVLGDRSEVLIRRCLREWLPQAK